MMYRHRNSSQDLTEILKNEDIPAPVWSSFVKTGAHADKPPQQPDWWYTRCASIMRKIYLHGPLTVNDMRTIYGDGKRKMYYGARHHRDASGAIIRNAIHGLEKLGYVEQVEKKGRVVSRQGMQKLDKTCNRNSRRINTNNTKTKNLFLVFEMSESCT